MTPSLRGLEILRAHEPKSPACTCLEHEGDDNACPIHGICYEDRRQDDVEYTAEERDRQSETNFARYGGAYG